MKAKITAIDILKHNGLRHTLCREAILKLFLLVKHALTHADIETKNR